MDQPKGRRRRRALRNAARSASWRSLVALRGQLNSKPRHDVADTPKASRMTCSYCAPASGGTNQRSPTLMTSSGNSRRLWMPASAAPILSSVSGKIASSAGVTRPRRLRQSARALTPAAAFWKLVAWPRMWLCRVGGPSKDTAMESMPDSTSSRALRSNRPPWVMTLSVSFRRLTSWISGRMSGYKNGSPPKRLMIGWCGASSSNNRR